MASQKQDNHGNHDDKKFNGVKVFAATMWEQRRDLGEAITQWLADHPDYVIVDRTVSQSSDSAYHCLSICLWYHDPAAAARVLPAPVFAPVITPLRAEVKRLKFTAP